MLLSEISVLKYFLPFQDEGGGGDGGGEGGDDGGDEGDSEGDYEGEDGDYEGDEGDDGSEYGNDYGDVDGSESSDFGEPYSIDENGTVTLAPIIVYGEGYDGENDNVRNNEPLSHGGISDSQGDYGSGPSINRTQNAISNNYFNGNWQNFINAYNNFLTCGAANCNGFNPQQKGFLSKALDFSKDTAKDTARDKAAEHLAKEIFSKIGEAAGVAAGKVVGGALNVLGALEPEDIGNQELDAAAEMKQLEAFGLYMDNQDAIDNFHPSTLPELNTIDPNTPYYRMP
jgi:hypothetical protein